MDFLMQREIMSTKIYPFLNREISWLYFNERVLQEAEDETVPLLERIKFLAIYSSNLEEFYRVRVATLVRLANLNDQSKVVLGYSPKKLLAQIKTIVVKQERKFEYLFSQKIVNQLSKEKIFILNDKQLNVERGGFVRQYFRENILSQLVPIMVRDEHYFPELKDRTLYFLVELVKENTKKSDYAWIELPTHLPRFLILPKTNDLNFVILLDDIIKYCLDDIFYIFKYISANAYSIQITRDAELDLEKEVDEKFIEELKKSLDKRKKGHPMRLIYDGDMPVEIVKKISKGYKIDRENLIKGNKYHKFSDFYKFPDIGGEHLKYPKFVPLAIKGINEKKSLISNIADRDFLINLPYQSFEYILLFLREAAIDPSVKSINITLYRLAENSRVINALINAAKNGKKVNCLVELKARFDEQANLFWTSNLIEAGVNVIYGLSNYKVHSKICLISRLEKGKLKYYANLSTGNYNEESAGLYCDHSIFTSNHLITSDLKRLFAALNKGKVIGDFKTLIVSPLDSRNRINKLIKRETNFAKAGKPASIIIKVNSLADEEMIHHLYKASNAGVKIQLIVRGICCLVPGIPGFSENITVVSIIDKFLEHARVFLFRNNGNEELYLSSGDLMNRNLDKRVEVGFPVLNIELKEEIKHILNLQLNDNVKARIIDSQNKNKYNKNSSKIKIRSQFETYNYLKNKHQ
ncbi:polyphosphate kinase 1 [Pedobacter flavus]|uniref:Polyphosphate kinase n=1 Tax=Pedobacter flavus TaxID=3113906 RepID=A0ABU7H362_9SPHI|nr:polyphosphate kinase 1 [Pedobacter sp. VNH31]MEE1885759.1 polyphosphate kinase 1 [Pedobacter sp. VNH31]